MNKKNRKFLKSILSVNEWVLYAPHNDESILRVVNIRSGNYWNCGCAAVVFRDKSGKIISNPGWSQIIGFFALRLEKKLKQITSDILKDELKRVQNEIDEMFDSE